MTQKSSEEFLTALFTLPEIWEIEASPDAQWVAWAWLGIDSTPNIYAVRTDGKSEPIQLTDNDQLVELVAWTPDSKAVIVASDDGGDERVQLFRVDLDNPRVMQALTEANPKYYIRGGTIHPNNRWLFYAANLDLETGEEIEASSYICHDLQTGERFTITRTEKSTFSAPQLNDQGTHILYFRSDLHPAGDQLWLVDIMGEYDREILNFGDDKKIRAEWMPDGEHVMFLTETDTYYKLGIYSLADASIQWIFDDSSRNIERFTIPHNSRYAVLLEPKMARTKYSLLDLETFEEQSIPDVRGTLSLIAPLNDSEWIATHYSSSQVSDIIRVNIADPSDYVSLAKVWERVNLSGDDFVVAEDFRWKSVDGLDIQGWLYRARSHIHGTIVYVHGGPTWHSEDWINLQIQYLVSQGFNVLDPNYRGSTGFSREYMQVIKEDGWGGREQDDIRAGIDALITAGIAEQGKIGITGTSYGGYSAWFAATHQTHDIIAASAPICGMTDLVIDYETTRPDLRPYSAEMMGGTPSEVPQRYHERSPIHFVENIECELLIVQGLRDPNVTPENVRAVGERLQQAGKAYQLLTFEDEGHGITRKENRKAMYERLVEFFSSAFNR